MNEQQNEITDVKIQNKRLDRRSVYINNEYAFSVSEGICFSNNLEVGRFLSEKQIKLLKSLDENEKIKQDAFRLLGYRQRSIKELTDKLIKKGWEPDQVQTVIQELINKGFLDDLEFARMFAREKVKLKFIGPPALRGELFKVRIEKEIQDQVVEDIYTEFPTIELIRSLLSRKKIKTFESLDEKQKKRIINMLRRKGFNWDDIQSAIKE
tara:strand:- start:809 stop:1438 length:630 start_codon:yes stop_codon:yes gene_type:complete